MTLDYLPIPKVPNDDDASAAAEKRDLATRYGGTYLAPGKIYRNETDSARETIKKRLDEAEREDHKKSYETLTKGAVHVEAMPFNERAIYRMKQSPIVVLGILGSFTTIFFGVRAAYKGREGRSTQLMSVRLGFGILTVSALLIGQHMQKVKYQERLQALKKDLLKELGEDEDSLTS
ncbi:uncharacterized protein LOC110449229 [Mizuhopecten yessoensis]|uniref:Respiratory supercomplex factor 1, mitochondrial n=1 Tax=Mizuhopecten yessoensis TaxID=6573 RepID=A0A210QRQ6_MIZYE|nr:uncharacterized protein LOC110449229 [Mizuhopecten yessoensis]OWF51414.1 Respiratory supercomplex factor 1, mitochondrial [Mizuhopecten yessoensis]